MKEKIVLREEEFEVDLAPITLITKSSNIIEDLKYPERLMIDSEMSVYHARLVEKIHNMTEKFFRIIFPNYSGEFSAHAIRQTGTGAIHVLGLIDLSLKLTDQKVNIGWKYPESYLHPANQANLADALLAIQEYYSSNRVDIEL